MVYVDYVAVLVVLTNHSCSHIVAVPSGAPFTHPDLSYQTLSTTGYGDIYVKTSSRPGIPQCIGMTMLTSLEGYFGLVFASMFAAIMIVKVTRIQSHAPVEFSGPIVVNFGHDAVAENQIYSEMDQESCDSFELANLPLPTLEIRLLNLMSAVPGGELVDCAVNVVAIIDENQAPQTVRDMLKGRLRKDRKRMNRRSTDSTLRMFEETSLPEKRTDRPVTFLDRADPFQILDETVRLRPQNAVQVFEEDESGYLLPKRIFSKLEVESPKHPLFNRSWLLRHVLDENSPLLTNYAREAVRRNNGCWPHDLNNHKDVRASIAFDQILVNFSGVSNAGGNSVYTQKFYDKTDLFVGYKYVSVLYTASEGSVAIDYDLAHDIMEQRRGEGEPIDDARIQQESSNGGHHIIDL
jgi:hypothetical protein